MIPNISPKIENDDKYLNQIFNTFIQSKFSNYTLITDETLEIYKTLLMLLKDYNLYTIINEIKYRVTSGEDLNDVFIDIIKNNKDLPLIITTYLTPLYEIENRKWIEIFS